MSSTSCGNTSQTSSQDIDSGLKLLPKLTYEHANLNAYSVMRMNLAAQVLSASVAAVLKSFGPPETTATAKLCRMVDSFFDCLNVQSITEHERKRKPFLAPFMPLNERTNNGSIFQLFCVIAIWFDCRTQSNSIMIWVRFGSIEVKFNCVWLAMLGYVFYMSFMQFAFPFTVNVSPGMITLLAINTGLESYTVWAITLIKVKGFDKIH